MSPKLPRDRSTQSDSANTDSTRTDADSPPDGTRPADGARSPDATRRQVVRSLGAGAVLLGGSTALSGSAAGQSGATDDAVIEGIEDWSLSTERIDASEVQDGPTVTFGDDEVVVTGSYVFSRTGCDTFAARRIHHSEENSRLGVIVEAVPTDTEGSEDEQVCADALMPLRYELRVTPEAHTREVVVEESFTDDGRSYHPRVGLSGPEPLPTEVTEYDFTVGEEARPDGGGSISPDLADSYGPTITFDGDDVIVEGAMTYGSSSCDEIALTTLQRQYDVEGHVGVRLDAQREPTWMPGDGCTADLAAAFYRLELTGSGEPPIHRCSLTENPPDDYRAVTVEEADDDLDLPDGVRDHRLTIDRSDASTDDVESDPRVSFAPSDDGTAVQVDGTMVSGSSSCGTLAVRDVRWTDDDQTHLVARVDAAQRDAELEDCTDDVVTVDYQLSLLLDHSPVSVTAQEGHENEDEPERSATREREDLPPILPDGVLDYEFASESAADQEEVEADPSVSTSESADGPVVTVDGALLVSPCHTESVTDVRWADDAQSHLVVVTDAVGTYGDQITFDDCPLEALPRRTSYTVDLVLESLPDVVTAEEPNVAAGGPVRSTTVELGSDGSCTGLPDSATVDGRTVCDVDGDGLHRDVSGDGSLSQADVVEFFEVQHREAWKQPNLFDFDGSGSVGQGDVVALFEDVATQ